MVGRLKKHANAWKIRKNRDKIGVKNIWYEYFSSATAGFTGHEKTPVNQALPVFRSQFYQWFTNISGESDLQKNGPEWGD